MYGHILLAANRFKFIGVMKKILLIQSFLRFSPKSIEQAIQLAKKNNAELFVVFVIDAEFAENVANTLTDEGWLGGKPSEQLYASIMKEYQLQSELQVAEIKAIAEQKQVAMRAIIKSGPIVEQTLKIVTLEDPDIIVIARRKRSKLSRFIFGSVGESLKKLVNCEVKIIDSD